MVSLTESAATHNTSEIDDGDHYVKKKKKKKKKRRLL